jgi:hypothetical protein
VPESEVSATSAWAWSSSLPRSNCIQVAWRGFKNGLGGGSPAVPQRKLDRTTNRRVEPWLVGVAHGRVRIIRRAVAHGPMIVTDASQRTVGIVEVMASHPRRNRAPSLYLTPAWRAWLDWPSRFNVGPVPLSSSKSFGLLQSHLACDQILPEATAGQIFPTTAGHPGSGP